MFYYLLSSYALARGQRHDLQACPRQPLHSAPHGGGGHPGGLAHSLLRVHYLKSVLLNYSSNPWQIGSHRTDTQDPGTALEYVIDTHKHTRNYLSIYNCNCKL
jgi:hypothetical protein